MAVTVEDRIARWRGEEGGAETEEVVVLMVDAEAELRRLRAIATEAVGNARVLASCYERDCRPPGKAIDVSLAYPVRVRELVG